MKWMKTVLKILVGLAALGGAGYGVLRALDARMSEAAAVRYRTAPVVRADIARTVEATGTVQPIKEVEVGAQVNGRIIKLFVDYNSVVTNGQVVALIDPQVYEANYKSALGELHANEANVKKCEAQLALAEKTLVRKQELVRKEMAPVADYDSALEARDTGRASLAAAKASVEKSQASVSQAKANLDYCTILSPVDGVVITRSVDEGQTVVSSMNAVPLLKLATDLKRIQVEATVPEADIGNVRDGQTVTFSVDSYPGVKFTGEVTQVRMASTTTSSVVTYPVIIEAENPGDRLYPGMTANISILVEEVHDVPAVTSAAFRYHPADEAPDARSAEREKGRRALYLLGADGRPERRAVETGLSDGTLTEIRAAEGRREGGCRALQPLHAQASAPDQEEQLQARAMSHLIEIRDLRKVYAIGEEPVAALDGVSLAVDAGEFVAIMGASGSGKSTMLNILGCLDTPTSGSYLLDGIEVARRSRTELAHIRNRKLGFVFQNFNLLARTSAIENVELPDLYLGRLGRAARRARARELLARVGLGGRGTHTPAQLSGGQQQRVAIARALMNEPPVLFADEPTGNLDTKSSVEIMNLFTALSNEGITIVMVTHEDDIAAYAKRRLVMRDGRLIRDERR